MDQPEQASASSWKRRFNSTQLERKRLVDRLKQRRARKQTKEHVAELEKRVQILARGEHATLIDLLIKENDDLRASLRRIQASVEEASSSARDVCEGGVIETCVRDGLLSSRNIQYNYSSPRSTTTTQPSQSGQMNIDAESDFMAPATCLTLQSLHQDLQPTSRFTASIIFQWASLVLPSHPGQIGLPLTPRQWVQAMLMWKMVNSPTLDYHFIFPHLSLEKDHARPTFEETKRVIAMPCFELQILHCLTSGTDLSECAITSHAAYTQSIMDPSDEQRRAILFCAFKIMNPWHNYFKSAVEFGLVFWALYSYLMFLTFPTEENLKATPEWILPTPAQISSEHPGYIDFLIWPNLRERLSLTWTRYDHKGLVSKLISNFEIPAHARASTENTFPLYLAPEDQRFRLKPQFTKMFEKMGGFSTSPDFAVEFPELMPYVSPPGASRFLTSLDGAGKSPPRQSPRLAAPGQQDISMELLGELTATDPAQPSSGSDSDSVGISLLGNCALADPVGSALLENCTFEDLLTDIGDARLSRECDTPTRVSSSPSPTQKVTETAIGDADKEFSEAYAALSPLTFPGCADLF